jgi:hypothetical protein
MMMFHTGIDGCYVTIRGELYKVLLKGNIHRVRGKTDEGVNCFRKKSKKIL